jgi:hypothetical protein
MAMIALGKDARLDVDAIRKYLAETWSDLPLVGFARAEGDDDVTLSFRVGEDDVILGRMPAPIPWSDLEGPCATSSIWPEAAEVLRGHAEHLIVTVMSEAGPIERAQLLTQVCAAICATCQEAVGALWADSTVVVSSKLLIELAKMLPGKPSIPIWVDVRIGTNPDGTTYGFTTGLAALLLKDLEVLSSPETPEGLFDRLTGLAEYLIENGPVIKDGHTIGESFSERIKVIYQKGSFGQPFRVMRLHYGAAANEGGCLMYVLLAVGGVGLLLCCCGAPVGAYFFWPR